MSSANDYCFCCMCFSICGHCPLLNLCTYIPSKWCACCGADDEMQADRAYEAELFHEQPLSTTEMDATAKFRDKSAINCLEVQDLFSFARLKRGVSLGSSAWRATASSPALASQAELEIKVQARDDHERRLEATPAPWDSSWPAAIDVYDHLPCLVSLPTIIAQQPQLNTKRYVTGAPIIFTIFTIVISVIASGATLLLLPCTDADETEITAQASIQRNRSCLLPAPPEPETETETDAAGRRALRTYA
ncbi:hypothetical protein D9615_008934 [Tricholomella constricta]|uniref:Transmembrane protein n=1 Tax=Tricholomella constricta TaxID=117010 RepID=A0A8H5H0U8_9AGAR|nr:hypothetical protein D9615_008934 [Tricholomella constricta]